MLHRELTFYETEDFFYFLPKENVDNRILLINRHTSDIVLKDIHEVDLCNICAFSIQQIYGIFGVLQLISGKVLITISKVNKVGEALSHPIYRVEDVGIVSYKSTDFHLTDAQKFYNAQYLRMLRTFLQSPFFYFSYTYDITHRLQRLYQKQASNMGVNFEKQSLFHRADRRFVWNHHLLADFRENTHLTAYCIPIIYGFFTMHKIEVNNHQFLLILISRRSIDRAGTRMFSRGIDDQGNVSNFVETEQIVLFKERATSFVQIRGSIPLHWSQYPDLRYKPPPKITPNAPHQESFCKHIKSILSPDYESMVMINLINHSGQEEPLLTKLRQIFHESASYLPKITLECFDFHHECRKNRWDRLSVLLESISHTIDVFGYFSSNSAGEVFLYQRGIFRSNCIDSLDRTNVVQSLIAKSSLERQLQHLGLIAIGQHVDDFPVFHHIYRNVWADNADALSLQYAGSVALKSDFTRIGKRRFVGQLQDGIKSLVRYYKNNFTDGGRQDAFDLILGHHCVNPGEGNTIRSPLARRNMLKVFTFPLFLLFSLSMCFFSILLPTGLCMAFASKLYVNYLFPSLNPEHLTEKFFYLLFWFSASSSCILLMFHYGKEFVTAPTLRRHR